ncbi:MAG TPA: twin-arginine translocation signal domain-containing protein, partial [Desulfobacterales bacterium]|nr:twin-arginine translocation signal domain-containing protein [Desulfobacterales bacterium]
MSNEQEKEKISETRTSTDTSAVTTTDSASEPQELLDEPSRRTFLKRVAVGGGGAMLAGAGTYAVGMHSLQGKPVDDYPLIDDKLFKPKDQRDVVLNFVSSKA